MADTIRETPVSPNSEGLKPPVCFAEWHNHNSSNHLDRQVVSRSVPQSFQIIVPLLMEAAKIAAALHTELLGSSVSVSLGDMLGLPFYAVSPYTERTVEITIQPNWEILFAFAACNSDLLLMPNHGLGTWFDSERNLHVLDVVVFLSSAEDSIRLGMLHRQRAIFDLQAGREISLNVGVGGLLK